ncbi:MULTISPECIES: helix-turn-helix domain-containing protein [unclassified Lacrimispora]|uniref:helix-turn-helix domain-containing protein n=1 Tax=unclassified Lacrimispora TaxID=2719232 RepID=UPI00376F9B30
MSIACNLLSESSLSVSCVSKQVGYLNCSKFITIFQRHYGMTPLKYRNSLSEATSNNEAE